MLGFWVLGWGFKTCWGLGVGDTDAVSRQRRTVTLPADLVSRGGVLGSRCRGWKIPYSARPLAEGRAQHRHCSGVDGKVTRQYYMDGVALQARSTVPKCGYQLQCSIGCGSLHSLCPLLYASAAAPSLAVQTFAARQGANQHVRQSCTTSHCAG